MYESPKGSMDQAIKNFCLAKKRHYEDPTHFGFPKKKKYNAKRSFYIENDKAKLVDSYHVKLPLIKVPARLAEEIRPECLSGKINNFVVSRGSNDRWYGEAGDGVVGIDMGVKTLMYLSTGECIANERINRKHAKRLKRYQRMMSRRKYNSARYKDIKKTFNKKNTYIKNVRKDLIHKATTDIVRKNMVVAIEDLNVRGMTSNHRLASAITDCGFGIIRRFLEYKSARFGTLLLTVNRWFPSSKRCSVCGRIKDDLSLSDRIYRCNCGNCMDRDVNAAINIRMEIMRLKAS